MAQDLMVLKLKLLVELAEAVLEEDMVLELQQQITLEEVEEVLEQMLLEPLVDQELLSYED